MIKRNNLLSLLLITTSLLTASHTRAETPLKSFETNSYESIITRYQGDSFLMVLWSVDCPPCIEELPALGKFHQENPKANLVMISTDNKNHQQDIRALMAEHGLSDIQHWVFDGESEQAIRFSIDPLWYGELPRSYFHHADNRRQAKTGRLNKDSLSVWITAINNRTEGL